MKTIIARHKQSEHIGICSVCFGYPLVVEVSLRFDPHGVHQVLIEGTSNQVNQFGGYTGMTPAGFRDFVQAIVTRVAFRFPACSQVKIISALTADAMKRQRSQWWKASQLIVDYIMVGFSEIYLDALMPCLDDPVRLPPETVALRSTQQHAAAEVSAMPCDWYGNPGFQRRGRHHEESACDNTSPRAGNADPA